MKQGLTLNGTLANIKQVEAKSFDDKVTPPKQILQVTVLDDSGLSLYDISDKDFLVKQDLQGKEVSLNLAYSVMNGKAYFRVVQA